MGVGRLQLEPARGQDLYLNNRRRAWRLTCIISLTPVKGTLD